MVVHRLGKENGPNRQSVDDDVSDDVQRPIRNANQPDYTLNATLFSHRHRFKLLGMKMMVNVR